MTGSVPIPASTQVRRLQLRKPTGPDQATHQKNLDNLEEDVRRGAMANLAHALTEARTLIRNDVPSNERVWRSADFPTRERGAYRPVTPAGQTFDERLSGISGVERRKIILESLGMNEEHTAPYPNLDAKDPEIEFKIDYLKLYSDFRYFCESFLWIRTKEKQKIPFRLNLVQLHFLFNRTGRDLINKGRQHGFTTLMLAYYLWDSLRNQHTVTFILTHKKKATINMIRTIKSLWRCLPDCIRPELLIDNKEHLKFSTESEIIAEVVSEDAGRSYTCNNLLCSEFSQWKIDEGRAAGILQSIPKTIEGGSITIESTPYGIGNYYHRLCESAMNPHAESTFKYFEYPWYLNPDYDDAWKLIAQTELEYNTKEAGRRMWYQEYCCSFEQSRRRFFEKKTCVPMARIRLRIEKDPSGNPYPNYAYIFQEPVPGRSYVLGVDTCEGLEHGDYNSGTVIDRLTREEVAQVYGHQKPITLARIVNWLGRKYNMALLGVEDMQDGRTVLSYLVHTHEYPNLFYHLDNLGESAAAPLGWQMTKKTRTPMLSEFEEDVRTGTTKLAFWIRQREMEAFTRDAHGKGTAPSKMNDDTIISGAIANAMLAYGDMNQSAPEINVEVN
jgi:hypothetical protein